VLTDMDSIKNDLAILRRAELLASTSALRDAISLIHPDEGTQPNATALSKFLWEANEKARTAIFTVAEVEDAILATKIRIVSTTVLSRIGDLKAAAASPMIKNAWEDLKNSKCVRDLLDFEIGDKYASRFFEKFNLINKHQNRERRRDCIGDLVSLALWVKRWCCREQQEPLQLSLANGLHDHIGAQELIRTTNFERCRLTGHSDGIKALVVSGDTLASGSEDDTIKLWVNVDRPRLDQTIEHY